MEQIPYYSVSLKQTQEEEIFEQQPTLKKPTMRVPKVVASID